MVAAPDMFAAFGGSGCRNGGSERGERHAAEQPPPVGGVDDARAPGSAAVRPERDGIPTDVDDGVGDARVPQQDAGPFHRARLHDARQVEHAVRPLRREQPVAPNAPLRGLPIRVAECRAGRGEGEFAAGQPAELGVVAVEGETPVVLGEQLLDPAEQRGIRQCPVEEQAGHRAHGGEGVGGHAQNPAWSSADCSELR